MSLFPNLGDMAKSFLASAKTKLLKLDLDHNGVSDVDEVLADLDMLATRVEAFTAKVSPAEAFAAINTFLPGKFTLDEVTALFAALRKGIAALQKLQALLANVEKVL